MGETDEATSVGLRTEGESLDYGGMVIDSFVDF
jgi:hypothetical protein